MAVLSVVGTGADKEMQQADMLRMLDNLRVQVERGEIIRLGVVFCLVGGEWGTEFSATSDCRLDAAMLIELGIRRLGFATRGP